MSTPPRVLADLTNVVAGRIETKTMYLSGLPVIVQDTQHRLECDGKIFVITSTPKSSSKIRGRTEPRLSIELDQSTMRNMPSSEAARLDKEHGKG